MRGLLSYRLVGILTALYYSCPVRRARSTCTTTRARHFFSPTLFHFSRLVKNSIRFNSVTSAVDYSQKMSVLSQFCLPKWKSVESLTPTALVYNLSRCVRSFISSVCWFACVARLALVNGRINWCFFFRLIFIFAATVFSLVRTTRATRWNSTR